MNPLVSIRIPIPFDEIQAAQVEPAMEQLLAEAQAAIDLIAAAPGERTWAHNMEALDNATERLDYAMTLVRHIESVATSPEMRAAHNAVEPKVSEFYSKIPLHEGLWRALLAFSQTEEAKALRGVRRRALDKTLDEFRRHGAELDAAGKQRLAEIDVELARLTTRYSEHVLDATNAYDEVFTDEARLAGLPPSAIEAARAAAKAKGLEGWRFTLQAPSYVALMTYLDDGTVRERFYRAYQTRAAREPFDNRELAPRILEMRKAKARLLGFADFADFALVDRMAKTGRAAAEFLADLETRTEAAYVRENEELQAFRRSLEGPDAPPLQPWDVGYYAEKQRKAKYDFEEEELRPYFPEAQVLAGMFAIVERLYGVQVVEVPGVPVPSAETVKATFDSFDVVFTNTHSSRQHAIGRGQAPERILVSPVGFDVRGFPDPRQRAYRRDGRLNVLMVGRLSEEKGFLFGLQAVKVLIDAGQDIAVRIVGDGPQRQELASFIAEHGLASHVDMLGRVDQEDLRRHYSEADVFLLPSVALGTWEENQACVVQEALFMRAVVAVSRTGGVCESTAPAMLPYSCDPGSVPGMVSSLQALAELSEPQLRALGALGRGFVEARYDIRVLNRELLDAAMACGRGGVMNGDTATLSV